MKAHGQICLTPTPSCDSAARGIYAASPCAHSEASRTTHHAPRSLAQSTLNPQPSTLNSRAFTLIEMLVVIAIIAILAGMIVPLASLVAKKKDLARARAEIDALALAIDQYHNKKGFYPPDNTNTAFVNPLFYELWGMIASPTTSAGQVIYFTNTFNANPNPGGGYESITSTLLQQNFNVGGVQNSSPDTNEIVNFFHTLKAQEIQNIGLTAQAPVWVFASVTIGPKDAGLPVSHVNPQQQINVIRYVSSNPTNNPSSYDLWVDVLIAGKTNRVSNWSKDSQTVGN